MKKVGGGVGNEKVTKKSGEKKESAGIFLGAKGEYGMLKREGG